MNNIPQVERKYVMADIMKKRKHQTSIGEQRARQIKEKIKQKKVRVKDYEEPENFVKKYRKQQKAYSYYKKKQVKQNLDFDSKSLPINKTLLVLRIRGFDDLSDKQDRILKEFHLSKINTAAFIKGSMQNWKKLKLIENYIAYGIPTRKVINDLIVKRGHIIKEKEMIALKSNEIIEEHMSEQGIICIEDIVNQIADQGEHFEFVTQFLAPFKLNNAKLKSKNVKKPLEKGGEWGYREERINELVEKMI